MDDHSPMRRKVFFRHTGAAYGGDTGRHGEPPPPWERRIFSLSVRFLERPVTGGYWVSWDCLMLRVGAVLKRVPSTVKRFSDSGG